MPIKIFRHPVLNRNGLNILVTFYGRSSFVGERVVGFKHFLVIFKTLKYHLLMEKNGCPGLSLCVAHKVLSASCFKFHCCILLSLVQSMEFEMNELFTF
jgi:hypothetical protein